MKEPPAGVPLSDTLRVLLPRPDRALLLRAMLLGGAPSRSAWDAWRCAAPGADARAALAGEPAVRRHVALLDRAIGESGLAVDERLRGELRLVALRESLRSATFRRICGDVLEALGAAGVPVIAGKGLALAETAYPDPALRHCHDIDLLVPARARERAGRALVAAGFAAKEPAFGVELRHETGLPLRLHARLADVPFPDAPIFEWLPAQERTVAGKPARILEPAALLVLICAHAALARPIAPLAWAVDAQRLIVTAPDLDWEHAVRLARRMGLALPVSVMLGWLAAELHAPVPPRALAALRRLAAAASAARRDIAIHGGWAVAGGFMPLVRASASLASWAGLARWLLLPTPRYLRWTRGAGDRAAPPGGGLAGAYLERWLVVARAAVGTIRELRAASGRASP